MTHYQRTLLLLSFFLVMVTVCTSAVANENHKKKKYPKWMQRNYLSLGWSSAMPLADTYSKTEGFSPAGAELSYQLRLHPRLTLGPDLHWQLFDAAASDRHIAARTDAPSQINTWLERRFFCTTLTVHYYFLKRKTMLPYVGLGFGTMRVREKRGVFVDGQEDNTNWHVLTAPEVGMYLLHGRIPVWIAGRLFLGIHTLEPASEKNTEMLLVLTLGVTVPN